MRRNNIYPALFRGSGNCGDEMNNIFIMKRVTNNFYKELDSIYLRSIILRKQENCLARVIIQRLNLSPELQVRKVNSKRDNFD